MESVTHEIIDRACRMFNETYPDLPRMTRSKFRRIQANFLQFGQIRAERNFPEPVVNDEVNKVNVLAYFETHPTSSIRAAEQDMGISKSSIQKILSKHHYHDYKFSRVQNLHPQDPRNRVNFCETMLQKSQEDDQFWKKIIWTDECKFSNEGIFNRHNQHVWSTVNPHMIRPGNFQFRFSFNVFCLMMENKISYLIYDENLNSERYRQILRTVVEDFLDDLPLNVRRSCWYQLDGAPAHCTQEISQQLTLMFDDRWIRRLGPCPYPARSPDLTPPDFHLWGYLKDQVYSTVVNSREELLQRVRDAFQNLDPDQIRRATIEAVPRRIAKCLEVNGHHFEHLL